MRRLLLTCLSFCFLAGCDSPFPPSTLVERLRVLALRAEPPEVEITGATELTALVADPQGNGRELSAAFAVCLVEIGTGAADIPCPGPGSYAIPGQGLQASLSLPALAAWLQENGFPIDPGGGQLPESVPLVVGFEVRAGEESVRTVKRLTVRLAATAAPNLNPGLVGLESDGLELPGGTPLEVKTAAELPLHPLPAEDSRQTYRRQGEDTDRVEDLLFSWFSTAGEFSDDRTVYGLDSQGAALQDNNWTAPEEPGPATLWLVVRDGRYGEDWLAREILVVP